MSQMETPKYSQSQCCTQSSVSCAGAAQICIQIFVKVKQALVSMLGGDSETDCKISQSPRSTLTFAKLSLFTGLCDNKRPGAMAPVFDALHAVFPDVLPQLASATDEAVSTASDAAQTPLQPSVEVTQAYSGRISIINVQVCFPCVSAGHR